MPVNPSNMMRQLGRLSAALGKPFTDAKLEVQATEYSRAMGSLPEYAVEWAVDRAVRDSTKYPKAAELRNLAKQCPMLANGNHDDSLRARMQRWEQDPWAGIESLDHDKTECTSQPCPVCGTPIRFSSRGAVIVHDRQRHTEAGAPYSNIGREAWFKMPAPVYPEPKKRLRPRTPNPFPALREPTPIAEALAPHISEDERWDQEQQDRAAAEAVA